jgi:glyoxylase-like metal-dependent hydrolase (beta-lactamase superfamily II)
LPGGHYDTLIRSIQTRLFVLPDETAVYNGHMELTTIGQEKRYNPFCKMI